ncbi:MAG TPA: alpha/beta hydrolase [Flavipsychrobacter sp.]
MEKKNIHTAKFPQLSYNMYGKGDVIVLLHGFPLDSSLWDKIVPTLAEDYLVIVPDLPGSGKSTFEGNELSIDEMAESVRLILVKEQVNKVVLAGHSMGGYVALAFADLYPDAVKGLALVHSSARSDTEEKKRAKVEIHRAV